MASQLSEPSILLHRISQITNASGYTAQKIVESVSAELVWFLPEGASVSILFKSAKGQPPAAHQQQTEAAPGGPVFVFSRPLKLRGVDYGSILVESPSPKGSISEWMTALETAATLLALTAEQLLLLDEQHGVKKQLAASKLVARAGGLVAKERGLSMAGAQQWIRAESLRTGRSLMQFADLLILNDTVQNRSFPGRPRFQQRGVA